jgi:Imidazoleglycerol-phosphate synthase
VGVGGGIKNKNDIHEMLEAGAEKVAIKTHPIRNENRIYQAPRKSGSQGTDPEIQAKKEREGEWEAHTERGRERHKLDAIEGAKKAESVGGGEIPELQLTTME